MPRQEVEWRELEAVERSSKRPSPQQLLGAGRVVAETGEMEGGVAESVGGVGIGSGSEIEVDDVAATEVDGGVEGREADHGGAGVEGCGVFGQVIAQKMGGGSAGVFDDEEGSAVEACGEGKGLG